MACEPNQDLEADVELEINGKQIELNEFVQNFVAHTIIGMVKSLRGAEDVKTLELKIAKK